ncbi:MAG: mannonate dehydratase [Fuerstiella sp.]
MMQLATVLTPESDKNLRLAAQCGVTDMVTRYPGSDLSKLAARQQRFAEFGLRLSVVEGYLPIENIKTGTDDGTELAALKSLIRTMGQLQIPILCYNFMAGTDWVRTRLDAPERGGALVTAFDLQEANRAVQPSGPRPPDPTPNSATPNSAALNSVGHQSPDSDSSGVSITADQLWDNLSRLLQELIPVAEQSGVILAMHPDDPPLSAFAGRARIMNTVDGFRRLVQTVPSRCNAICFCQGTFAEMGVDIPDTIRELGPHIAYVHFRDVRGTAELFTETFHDNGQTDMVAAMRAYRDIGLDGPIRADHVPQLHKEDSGEPGYTMLGRLFAWGYIRGLLQAANS